MHLGRRCVLVEVLNDHSLNIVARLRAALDLFQYRELSEFTGLFEHGRRGRNDGRISGWARPCRLGLARWQEAACNQAKEAE